MIPQGTDALSPAPHHDIYSIEDLRQLIYAIKEATDYKPVGVKIAAVHNVAAIATGIVRAGADIIYLDGFRGGTGAAPTIIRDHVGIPIEIASRSSTSGCATRASATRPPSSRRASIRSSADLAKAIALGADAVAIGTAALIAAGLPPLPEVPHGQAARWGITTQKPELHAQSTPTWGAERLVNLRPRAGATSSRRSSARWASTRSSRCAAAASACAPWASTSRLNEILGVKPAGM